jgi:hypothetical protein
VNRALQDLAGGRRRPFPRHRGDLKEGLVACGALLAIAVAYGVWHEHREGPRHVRNTMSALQEAGFPDAKLEREWLHRCRRGSKAYSWRSQSASGTACSYGDLPRASIRVDRLSGRPPQVR